MAQFYAEIQGSRGSASRIGTKDSGIEGHVRGWGIGGRVVMTHHDGKDVVELYLTSGSGGDGLDRLVARYPADG